MPVGKKVIGLLGTAIITGIGVSYHNIGTTHKKLPFFNNETVECPYIKEKEQIESNIKKD
tara:strand:- start:662 stop:841 length:180 start_codon:yes stop_codon:yes gene_type:complete